MPSTNYEIMLFDVNDANAGHAEMIGKDDWRVTSPEYSTIIKSNRASLITFIADSIGRGRVYRIGLYTQGETLMIDRCGNTWIDGKYLDPAVYLPKIVPDEFIDLS